MAILSVSFEAMVGDGRDKAIQELGNQIFKSATIQRAVLARNFRKQIFKLNGGLELVALFANGDGRLDVVHQRAAFAALKRVRSKRAHFLTHKQAVKIVAQ